MCWWIASPKQGIVELGTGVGLSGIRILMFLGVLHPRGVAGLLVKSRECWSWVYLVGISGSCCKSSRLSTRGHAIAFRDKHKDRILLHQPKTCNLLSNTLVLPVTKGRSEIPMVLHSEFSSLEASITKVDVRLLQIYFMFTLSLFLAICNKYKIGELDMSHLTT